MKETSSFSSFSTPLLPCSFPSSSLCFLLFCCISTSSLRCLVNDEERGVQLWYMLGLAERYYMKVYSERVRCADEGSREWRRKGGVEKGMGRERDG